MADELDENFLYNPYVAMIVDKDELGQQKFFEQFYRLDQPIKDFMTASQTTASIRKLFETGVAPDEYATAIAKIIAYVAIGEVPGTNIPQLLVKIGLPEQQAQTLATEMNRILESLKLKQTPIPQPTSRMPELPPLTRPTENGPRPVQAAPKRNIIDLRKQS